MSQPNRSQKGFIFSIILLGIISRFLPHPPNVTAVAAVTLLAGAVLNSRVLAILVPMVLMFVSDIAMNNTLFRANFANQEGLVMWHSYMTWVYVGFAITAAIGFLMLKKRNTTRLAGATVFATLAFWFVSNIGSFLAVSPMFVYPKTVAGFLACYETALPFLLNSLIGNLFFSFVIFGIYDFVNDRYFQQQGAIA